MQIAYRTLGLVLLTIFWAGCTTPTITNLTPSRLPRKENNQYAFAVEWSSRQRSLVKESMQAYVVIGLEKYAMERTPLLPDRWETLVPVPADDDVVTYHYRFDYEYRGMPSLRKSSLESHHYQLILLD